MTEAKVLPDPGPLPLGRWCGLIVLLAVEVVLISGSFDVHRMFGDDRYGTGLIGWSAYLFRVLVAVSAATLLVGGARLIAGLRPHADRLRSGRGTWPWLAGHLAALAVFVALTWWISERTDAPSSRLAAWFVGWHLAGLATTGFWAAALLPLGLWPVLIRSARGAWLIGAVLGGLAVEAGRLCMALWGPLTAATFAAVRAGLSLLPAEVVCRPERAIVGTTAFRVVIADVCSGFEGIGVLWCFLAAYLWLFRRDLRFPHALILVPLGTALMWLSNVIRLVTLIAIGTWVSRRVALEGFHSQAGWLAVNLVALALVLMTCRLRWFQSGAPDRDGSEGHAPGAANPAAALLLPLLALIGTMMLTRVATHDGFDGLYPARILAALLVLAWYRRAYAGLGWGWSWEAVGLGGVVFGLWMALEPMSPSPTPRFAGSASDPTWLPPGLLAGWLVFRALGSIVAVPLAEELAFRGYLTRRLIAADVADVPLGRFTWPSFLVSSLVFGLMHTRWLAGTLAGMAYALALYRRGRLGDAVFAHATTNALIAAYVLATGSWGLWQ
jgi:exosortase E/protease (VPEID-CTERM system)